MLRLKVRGKPMVTMRPKDLRKRWETVRPREIERLTGTN